MALHYDHTAIPEERRKYEHDGKTYMHPTLYALTFYSVPLGLPVLDDKTIDEWMVRLVVWEKLFESLRTRNVNGESVEAPIEYGDLQMYKGLSTNAKKLTRNQFMKNVWTRLDESLKNKE